jgi:hypothetical protein
MNKQNKINNNIIIFPNYIIFFSQTILDSRNAEVTNSFLRILEIDYKLQVASSR